MPLKKFGTALAACAVFTCAAMAVRAQALQPQPQPVQPKAVVQPRPVRPAPAPGQPVQPGVQPVQPGVQPVQPGVQPGLPRTGGMMMASPVTRAIAVIHPTKSGEGVHGEVTFTQTTAGVHVQGEVRGLKPGKHGFHIHEYGDVSSPDAMSAGSHFDPAMTKKHAAPDQMPRHAGDLGNITANDKGTAKIDYTDRSLSFSGPNSILGRAVIVHEKEDDLKTQPTGNAGGRLGAGVIGVAKAGGETK